LRVATPLEFNAELTTTVPPTLNCTVPVGVEPPPLVVTVAVAVACAGSATVGVEVCNSRLVVFFPPVTVTVVMPDSTPPHVSAKEYVPGLFTVTVAEPLMTPLLTGPVCSPLQPGMVVKLESMAEQSCICSEVAFSTCQFSVNGSPWFTLVALGVICTGGRSAGVSVIRSIVFPIVP